MDLHLTHWSAKYWCAPLSDPPYHHQSLRLGSFPLPVGGGWHGWGEQQGQGIPSRHCNWLPMKDPDGTFLASTKT